VDLAQDIDRFSRRAVHPLQPEAVLAGNLKVVDLFEDRFIVTGRVVLVRWIAGPVPAGGQHLDGGELHRLECIGGAEGVDLAAGRAGTGQLDGDVLGLAVPRLELSLAPGGGQRIAAAERGGYRCGHAYRQVGEVGDAREDRGASLELDDHTTALD